MELELKKLTAGLGESTATAYGGSYKRLRKILNLTDKRKPIKKLEVKDVLDKIQSVENPSTRHSVFVIAKKLYDYDKYKTLFDPVDVHIRKDKRELQIKKNGELTKTLPTYDEINLAVKKETNPKIYITSFIILKVNTRNQDVALITIHKNIDPILESELDKTRNHIIIQDSKAIYIRNVYKTVKKYGPKRNIITVKKFIDMCNQFVGDNKSKDLFTTKTGGVIPTSSMGSYMKRFIVLNLNEGQIVKAVLKMIDQKGSYSALRILSNNRGTNISTLLSEYDVSNINTKPSEVISQEQEVKQEVDIEVN